MDSKKLLERLERPDGCVDVVIDTDTYNEIDDQFALAYLIKSDDRLNLKAIYAAPFKNEKADTPEEGMEKSYREILKILTLIGRPEYAQITYKGSKSYLPDETAPVISDAANDLAARAMAQPEDKPLYVIAIGAITNVASALLIEPQIREKIVIIWLGGHAHSWPDTYEFNMYQDVAAARIVFGCQVPLIQLPCMGVVSEFRTTEPELKHWLKGKNALCDYLVDNVINEARRCNMGMCWSRVIWDVTAVAWLLDSAFMKDRLEKSPIPEYDHHYGFDPTRHLIKYVYYIDRDRLFADLFTKLAR